MYPIRYDDDGTAVFTTEQIDIYGYPTVDRYYVIETPQYVQPITPAVVWTPFVETKPPHRYCRLLRFRTTLSQLIGETGFKTGRSIDLIDNVMRELPCSISYTPPCMLWEEIRKVLKKQNLHIFYNRIPVIAAKLKLIQELKISTKTYKEILDQFKKLSEAFDQLKSTLGRTYFPSMRFMALRLCQEYNVNLNIDIPFCRTLPRYTQLNQVYNLLSCKVAENDFDNLFK